MMMIMTSKLSTRTRVGKKITKKRPVKIEPFFSKTHLSYSKINLWQYSRRQFVDVYFANAPRFETPELLFGKQFAEKLEGDHDEVKYVPRLSHSEFKVQCDVEGIPCLGFIDSLRADKEAFLEYKTGRVPWDKARVASHLQLDMYSLMLGIMFGVQANDAQLIWLETRKKPIIKDVMGYKVEADGKEIELTGKVEKFPRIITPDDRATMRRIIVNVAKEIEEEWVRYNKKALGL